MLRGVRGLSTSQKEAFKTGSYQEASKDCRGVPGEMACGWPRGRWYAHRSTPEVIGPPTHGSGGDPAAVHMGPKESSPTHPDADADPDPMPAPMACSSLQPGAVLLSSHHHPEPPWAGLTRSFVSCSRKRNRDQGAEFSSLEPFLKQREANMCWGMMSSRAHVASASRENSLAMLR